MKKFKLKTLCNEAGIKKQEGYSASEILILLIMLPLMTLKNVHQLYKSEYGKQVAMKKDALYRLKNNERYSWRRLMYGVSKAFKRVVAAEKEAERENGAAAEKGTKKAETKPQERTAIIIDDTPDQRVGYKIEKISKVFDHVLQKTVLGFKILTLAYYDGKSAVPLDFTVHAEAALEKKKAKAQYKKEADPKSAGGKRRKETKITKIKAAVEMIKRAIKNGYQAEYVLCDADSVLVMPLLAGG
jgi:hypothetical protein